VKKFLCFWNSHNADNFGCIFPFSLNFSWKSSRGLEKATIGHQDEWQCNIITVRVAIWPFWIWKQIVYFKACSEKSERNLQYSMKFYLWIELFRQILEENFVFFETTNGKFGLFKIWTWQPWLLLQMHDSLVGWFHPHAQLGNVGDCNWNGSGFPHLKKMSLNLSR